MLEATNKVYAQEDEADEEEDADEDDEIQTSPEADTEPEAENDTNNEGQAEAKDEENENDLTQIGKAHHEYINKEIDLEQSFSQNSGAEGDKKEKAVTAAAPKASTPDIALQPAKKEAKPAAAAPPSEADYDEDAQTIEAYIGAEMYSNRMFPQGCPSFQKQSIKLFKVTKNSDDNKDQFTLVDSAYYNNREGFGFMLKNLTKGDYQVQVKKYSFGFDVYDFTTRFYAPKAIKLVDVEVQETERTKAKLKKKKDNIGVSDTITESSNPNSGDSDGKQRFTKAGDQDTNEKRMVDVDPHTQIDMELHKGNMVKDV